MKLSPDQSTVSSVSGSFLGLLGLTIVLAYGVLNLGREDAILTITFTVVIGLFTWIYARSNQRNSVLWVLIAAVGLRLLSLTTTPSLSDDFWRFLWDGELWLAGYHPLDFVPTQAPPAFAKTHQELLQNMNSPGYFTIYPPLSQVVFTSAVWLGSTWKTGLLALQALLIAAEFFTLWLLFKLDLSADKKGWMLYALAPLVILEACANTHFEGFALLGLLLAIYGFRQNRPWLSGFGLAVGVAVKLVPAIAGPALLMGWLLKNVSSDKVSFQHLNFAAAIKFLGSALLWTLVFFLPFVLTADLTGFGESLDLYFRSFEFNGSLYSIARGIGIWYKGWNWIAVVGPTLAILSFAGILAISLYRGLKKLPIEETILWCFAIYIACATTVHPWYVIYLIGIGTLTSYRWPFVFGITAFISYLAYGTQEVIVPWWALVLEYGAVLLMLSWEQYVKKV